jgi:predicted phosphodiesterase
MRIAVLADIHGNLPALEAVIADMQQFEPEQVIVAGDSINWGPFSAEVVEHILASRWPVIRGNHEFYMLYYQTPFAPEHWHHFTTPDWLNRHLPRSTRLLIGSLPDELRLCYPGAPFIRMVHASPGNHWLGIYPTQTSEAEVCDLLRNVDETTVITAHTHLQMDRTVDRWHIVNPGSVGLPLDGNPAAGYAVLESDGSVWKTMLRRVDYDLDALMAACDRLDYVKTLGIYGRLMQTEFVRARPLVYSFNLWRQKYHAGEPDSLELVEDFLSQPKAILEFYKPDYRVNVEKL